MIYSCGAQRMGNVHNFTENKIIKGYNEKITLVKTNKEIRMKYG